MIFVLVYCIADISGTTTLSLSVFLLSLCTPVPIFNDAAWDYSLYGANASSRFRRRACMKQKGVTCMEVSGCRTIGF
ncbi:hypothetical protein EJ110_NYTH03593 [Nymphaea thermarum]|nr:hypothetical protein EJ110_NYTH03593 [Nymphaea thermarum]